jgi:hypothetical protein
LASTPAAEHYFVKRVHRQRRRALLWLENVQGIAPTSIHACQPKVLDSAFMQFAREDSEMEKALLVIFVFFVQYIIFNI